ncbi:phosphopentomutase [Lachnospira multipara]|uniref:phosphopentomutase n=1 Tax=Lachnospira multipara TaxID=28051 RepID=UPI0006841285|nr:phosphopentomutase [Lachnospira multipara]
MNNLDNKSKENASGINRVIWIVLDSVGVGEAPDSKDFGDVGVDTFGHTYKANKGLNIPNLISLGIGKIDGIDYIDNPSDDKIIGIYGKLQEKSAGKDTTIGHWEMAGIYSSNPFPTFPNGFSDETNAEIIKRANLPGILCNEPASGTEVINRLGDEMVKSGKPIIYTSADSVYQIAAHEDVISLDRLYEICQIARDYLQGDLGVARVIARPFIGENGHYVRTSNRRDFSLAPSKDNILNRIRDDKGLGVYAVGKIEDIFAGEGISEAVHTKDNMDGVDKTLEYMRQDNKGLIYTNLVEFDSAWGHRRDAVKYGKGLEDFDSRLPEIFDAMRDDDILIITADHGCDPTYTGTDHTREYVPVLMYGKKLKKNVNLHTGDTYADIAQTIAEIFNTRKTQIGTSRLKDILA